jgi:hypothetical protein
MPFGEPNKMKYPVARYNTPDIMLYIGGRYADIGLKRSNIYDRTAITVL